MPSIYGTDQFESPDAVVSRYKTDIPEASSWGPQTLYATLVKNDPTLEQRTKNGAPTFRDKSGFLSAVRAAKPDVSAMPDDELWSTALKQAPGLRIFDDAPESEAPVESNEDPFFAEHPQWIGPKPKGDIKTLKSYKAYAQTRFRNTKGQAGFIEQAGSNSRAAVPYLDSILDVVEIGKVGNTALKLSRNEAVSDDELMDLNTYFTLEDRAANATWLGQAGGGLMASLGFVGEVAGALYTGGAAAGQTIAAKTAAAAGKRSLVAAGRELVEKMNVWGTKRALRSLGVKGVEAMAGSADDIVKEAGVGFAKRAMARTAGALASSIPAGAVFAAEKTAVTAAGAAALGGPAMSVSAARNQLADRMQGIDDASINYLWKGLITDAVDSATEFTGAATLGVLTKDLASPILGKLASAETVKYFERAFTRRFPKATPEALRKAAEATVKDRIEKTAVATWFLKHGLGFDEGLALMKRVGKDSVVEEMLEERNAGFWHGLLGTDNDPDAGAIDGVMVSPDQLKAEFLQFSIPFIALGAANFAKRKALGTVIGRDFYSDRRFMLSNMDGTKVEKPSDTEPGKIKLERDTRVMDEATVKNIAKEARVIADTWDQGVSNSMTAKVIKAAFDVATFPFHWDTGVMSESAMEQALGDHWNFIAAARGTKKVLQAAEAEAKKRGEVLFKTEDELNAKVEEVLGSAFAAVGSGVVVANSKLQDQARAELEALDKSGRLTADEFGRVFIKVAANTTPVSQELRNYLAEQGVGENIAAPQADGLDPATSDAIDISKALDFSTPDAAAKALSLATILGIGDAVSAHSQGNLDGFIKAIQSRVAVNQKILAAEADLTNIYEGAILHSIGPDASQPKVRVRVTAAPANAQSDIMVEDIDALGKGTGKIRPLSRNQLNNVPQGEAGHDATKWTKSPRSIATGIWGFTVGTETEIKQMAAFNRKGGYNFRVGGAISKAGRRPVIDANGNPELDAEGEPVTEQLYRFRANAMVRPSVDGSATIFVSPWAPPSAVAEDYLETAWMGPRKGMYEAKAGQLLKKLLSNLQKLTEKTGSAANSPEQDTLLHFFDFARSDARRMESFHKLVSMVVGLYTTDLEYYAGRVSEIPLLARQIADLEKLARKLDPTGWENFITDAKALYTPGLGTGWEDRIRNPYLSEVRVAANKAGIPAPVKKPSSAAVPPAKPAPAAQPITPAPAAQPITPAPAAQPITPAPAAQPITPAPAAQPITPAPAAQPITPAPAAQPITPAPAAQPITPAPAAQPITPAPAAQPITPAPAAVVEDEIDASGYDAVHSLQSQDILRSPWMHKARKPVRSALPHMELWGLLKSSMLMRSETDSGFQTLLENVDIAIDATAKRVRGLPDNAQPEVYKAALDSVGSGLESIRAAVDAAARAYEKDNPLDLNFKDSQRAIELMFVDQMRQANAAFLQAKSKYAEALQADAGGQVRSAMFDSRVYNKRPDMKDSLELLLSDKFEADFDRMLSDIRGKLEDADIEMLPGQTAEQRLKSIEHSVPAIRVLLWNLQRYIPRQQDHSSLILDAIYKNEIWFGGAERNGPNVFSSLRAFKAFRESTPQADNYAGLALHAALKRMPISLAMETGRYLRSLTAARIDPETGEATASGALSVSFSVRQNEDGTYEEAPTSFESILPSTRVRTKFTEIISQTLGNILYRGTEAERQALADAADSAVTVFQDTSSPRSAMSGAYIRLMDAVNPGNGGMWQLSGSMFMQDNNGILGPAAPAAVLEFAHTVRGLATSSFSAATLDGRMPRLENSIRKLYDNLLIRFAPNDAWQQATLLNSDSRKPAYTLRSIVDAVFSPTETSRISSLRMRVFRVDANGNNVPVVDYDLDDSDANDRIRTLTQRTLIRRAIKIGKGSVPVVLPVGGKSELRTLWIPWSEVGVKPEDLVSLTPGAAADLVSAQALAAMLRRLGVPVPDKSASPEAQAKANEVLEKIMAKRGEKFTSPGLIFDPTAEYTDEFGNTGPVGSLKAFVVTGIVGKTSTKKNGDTDKEWFQPFKGSMVLTRGGRKKLEAAAYGGRLSEAVKAHGWNVDGKGTIEHSKTVLLHPDHVAANPLSGLMDAVRAYGYDAASDGDGFKLFRRGTIQVLNVGGVQVEGYAVDVRPEQLYEVAYLSATSDAAPRKTPSTLLTDAVTMGSDRTGVARQVIKFIQTMIDKLESPKDEHIEASLTRHNEAERAHIAGQDMLSYPPFARLERELYDATMREKIHLSGTGTFALQVPSGGTIVERDIVDAQGNVIAAAGTELWPFGIDKRLSFYSVVNGRTVPQGALVNIRGNGVRRTKRIVFPDSQSRNKFVDSLRTSSGDDALALIRDVLARNHGAEYVNSISLDDLLLEDRGSTFVDVDGGIRSEGDKILAIRGSLYIADRTPSADTVYSHVLARIEDWASYGKEKGLDNETPGADSVIVLHPQTIKNGGPDFDGDQMTVRMPANHFDGSRWVPADPDSDDEREAQQALANDLFWANANGYSNPMLQELMLDSSIDTGRFLNARIPGADPKQEWKLVGDVLDERVVTDPLAPSAVEALRRRADNQNQNRAMAVITYNMAKRVFHAMGAAFDPIKDPSGSGLDLAFPYVGPSGKTEVLRLARPKPGSVVVTETERIISDMLFSRAVGDLESLVLDNPAELEALGFDSVTIPLFGFMGAGYTWEENGKAQHAYRNAADVDRFIQAFVAFVHSPVIARYRAAIREQRPGSETATGSEESSAKQAAKRVVEEWLLTQSASDKNVWDIYKRLDSAVFSAFQINRVVGYIKNPIRTEVELVAAKAAVNGLRSSRGILNTSGLESSDLILASREVIEATERLEFQPRASVLATDAAREAFELVAKQHVDWIRTAIENGRPDPSASMSTDALISMMPMKLKTALLQRSEHAALAEILVNRIGADVIYALNTVLSHGPRLESGSVDARLAAAQSQAGQLYADGRLAPADALRPGSPFAQDVLGSAAYSVVEALKGIANSNDWVRSLSLYRNDKAGTLTISGPSTALNLDSQEYARIRDAHDQLAAYLPGGTLRIPVRYEGVGASGNVSINTLWLSLTADQVKDIVAAYAMTRPGEAFPIAATMSTNYHNALARQYLTSLRRGLWSQNQSQDYQGFVQYLAAQADPTVMDQAYVPYLMNRGILQGNARMVPAWAMGSRGATVAELLGRLPGILSTRAEVSATTDTRARPEAPRANPVPVGVVTPPQAPGSFQRQRNADYEAVNINAATPIGNKAATPIAEAANMVATSVMQAAESLSQAIQNGTVTRVLQDRRAITLEIGDEIVVNGIRVRVTGTPMDSQLDRVDRWSEEIFPAFAAATGINADVMMHLADGLRQRVRNWLGIKDLKNTVLVPVAPIRKAAPESPELVAAYLAGLGQSGTAVQLQQGESAVPGGEAPAPAPASAPSARQRAMDAWASVEATLTDSEYSEAERAIADAGGFEGPNAERIAVALELGLSSNDIGQAIAAMSGSPEMPAPDAVFSLESAEAALTRGQMGMDMFLGFATGPERYQRILAKLFDDERGRIVESVHVYDREFERLAMDGTVRDKDGKRVGKKLTREQVDAARVMNTAVLGLAMATVVPHTDNGPAPDYGLMTLALQGKLDEIKARAWLSRGGLDIDTVPVNLGHRVTIGSRNLDAVTTFGEVMAAVDATGYRQRLIDSGNDASVWTHLNRIGKAASALGFDSANRFFNQAPGLGVMTSELQSNIDTVSKAVKKLSRKQNSADTLYTGAAADALITEFDSNRELHTFNTPGQLAGVMQAQIDILNTLDPNHVLTMNRVLAEGMNYAELNRLIAKRIYEGLVRDVEAGGAAALDTPDAQRRIRTLAALRNLFRYYDARGLAESAPDISGRSVTAPMAKATMLSQLKHGYSRVTAKVTSDAVVHQFTQALTAQGQPGMIVVPEAASLRRASEFGRHPEPTSIELMDAQAINLVTLLRNKELPAVYDLTALPKERLVQFKALAETTAKASGVVYKEVKTHIRGADRVFVVEDSAWAVAHWIGDKARWTMGGPVDLLQVAANITAWMKSTVVNASAFFLFSTGEGVIAATHLIDAVRTKAVGGISPQAQLKHRIADMADVPKRMLRNDQDMSDLLADAAYAGVILDSDSAIDDALGFVENDMTRFRDWIRENWGEERADRLDAIMRQGVRMQGITDRYFGRKGHRVGVFQNMKMYILMHTAEHVASKVYGVDFNRLDRQSRREIFREISGFINNAAGGQNWARYWWATPKVRQFMTLLMFAPNWTISALNVAGGGLVTGQVLGNQMGDVERGLVLANTAVMGSVVLFGIPAALQAAIYLAAGDPDDDHMFPWQNEPDRQMHIDVTPLVRRLPGYTGDVTGKRRMYLQFGKQALEVYDGWITDAYKTAMGKLSMPAKLILEQATGTSPGSDWNLEFNGQGMRGVILGKDAKGRDSFLRSRVGYALQKIIPMTVTSVILKPETWATTAIAPTSFGISEAKSITAAGEILNALAERDSWNTLKGHPQVKDNAIKYISEILAGAESNGYDSKRILQSAKSGVLTKLYKNFWGALDAGDFADMDHYARAILRVGGTLRGVTNSINKRRGLKGETMTPEESMAVEAAFIDAVPRIPSK